MGLFGLFGRTEKTHASVPARKLAPDKELELFLSRLSPRERTSLDSAFKEHTGKIASLKDLEDRFARLEKRLAHARATFNTQPKWALHQAKLARNHAKEIKLIAEHLKSFEAHEHERELAGDAFTIARYAEHAKGQAISLIDQLKPLVR